MRIDQNGNMELTAEENQDLMDQLEISESDYDDPPVTIEYTGTEDGTTTFTATNTLTGKSVVLVFDWVEEEGEEE